MLYKSVCMEFIALIGYPAGGVSEVLELKMRHGLYLLLLLLCGNNPEIVS